MSQWTDRVRTHPVWGQMTALGVLVDTAAARDGIEADALAGVERVRTILAIVGQRLASMDPALLVVSSLDGMHNAFSRAAEELEQFVDGGGGIAIQNANAQADNALGYAATIPLPVLKSELATLNRSATSYRDSVEAALSRVQAAAAKVESELGRHASRVDELAVDGNNIRQRAESFLAEVQSQFSRAQESRSTDFAESQQSRQDRFMQLVAENTEKTNAQLSELTATRTDAQKAMSDALSELRKAYETSAAAILARMEAQRLDVEKLVGVIGNLGLTSGYQKAAIAARNTKWFWQALTVAALCAVIGFAWKAFLPAVGSGFSWPSFAGRSVLTVAVGLLAAYAAKQSDKAAELESYNRGMALELEALGPFIAPLSAEKQEEFRLQLGERSFGGHAGIAQSQGDSSPATLAHLLGDKRLQTLLTELVKSAKA